MPLRTKIQIAFTLCASVVAMVLCAHSGSHDWLRFGLLLGAVLLSSGLKIALPRGDGSMTLNFPFIFAGIIQLSPLQAMLLAGLSVAAQCRIRVHRIFTAVQICFNVANTMLATACAVLVFSGFHKHGMGTAPALALASVAYFAWSTISVALVLASTKHENPFELWRTVFPWYLPFYMVGAVLAAFANWIGARFGWGTALLLIPFVYTLYRAYTGQVARLQERQRHLEETEALHLRTIEGLAMAIEAKDQGTHDHLFRVRHYVQAVGQAMQLSKLELQALETAAFLHDIGKLAVPEHILNKPGKLTPEEFEKMKIHPVVGADILERVRFPYPVVPIVRSHHEWWNGTGYPDGLRGTDIPLGARILTVIDCFDALVSDRPYRRGLPEAQALNMIRSLGGKQFDPGVVDAFERCHAAEQSRKEKIVPADFMPLKTDVEVWRGMAPGAGFEAGSHENAPSRTSAVLTLVTAEATQREDTPPESIANASQEAQEFFEMSQVLGSALMPEEFWAVIALRLRRLVPCETMCLYWKTQDNLQVSFQDGPRSKQFAPEPLQLGEGITGWVARSGRPLLNGNAAVEPGCPLTEAGAPALRSALAIPLFDLQLEVFAVLTLYGTIADAFTRGHLRTLLTMESKLSLALQNLRRPASTIQDENSDFLTGLPNARRLFLHLEAGLLQAEDHHGTLELVVCDLNNFREVNERRGQLAANRLLRSVADHLRQIPIGNGLLARVGGDEFAFVLLTREVSEGQSLGDAITEAIYSAARRSGYGSSLTASVGMASFPADGLLAEDLLAVANRRMYLDKKQYHSSETALSVRSTAPVSVACSR